ncbi:MAG: hypothetical protein U9N30_03995, partial [Campylobacterota bacterium]|nr:hypothetical protein [Campylobacterota bacterium]
MKIILYSTQAFLKDEVNKLEMYTDINVISDVSQVFNIIQNNEYFIFLHHLDSEEDYLKTTTLLQENFLDFSLIALRNTTNNIEGCSVLKKGYKAYINSTGLAGLAGLAGLRGLTKGRTKAPIAKNSKIKPTSKPKVSPLK